MKTPSILITFDDGKPSVELVDMDADKAIQAYKSTDKAAMLFVRPACSRSKKAADVAPVAVQEAKKVGRPRKS